MNTKALAAVAIIAVVAVAGVAVVLTNPGSQDNPQYDTMTDNFGRTIILDKVPERVAVVNTDIMYFMQILGLEDKIIGMDTDGREKIPSSTDRIDINKVKDIGKRSAFSGTKAVEKMLDEKIDCVLSPTTMGIGTTVSADTIEGKGIKVVYINGFGEGLLDNLDLLVKLFGNTEALKAKSQEFRDYYTSFITKAKTVMPSPDRSQDYAYYMSSSSGTLGSYYLSSSELNGVVSSISGTNRAVSDSGSFTQIQGEKLVNVYYDNAITPRVDYVFIRGTDGYTCQQVYDIFLGQELPDGTYLVSDYIADHHPQVYYMNTHIVSGAMCCMSYLAYAYVFSSTLDATAMAEINHSCEEFMGKYGFLFLEDAEHPFIKLL